MSEVEESNCKKCRKKVKESDSALQCDRCIEWWHIKCGKIDKKVYDLYQELDHDVFFWFCPECKEPMKQILASNTINVSAKEEIMEVLQSINTEIKVLKEKASTNQASYADVARMISNSNNTTNSVVNIPKPVIQSGVIITHKDPDVTSSKTLDMIKTKLDAKRIEGGLTLKLRGKGGCFMGTVKKVNQEDLEKEVAVQLGDEFVVRVPKEKRPQLLLCGVKKEFNGSQLAEEILACNQWFDEEDSNQIKVVHKRCRKSSSGDRWDYIIEADDPAYEKLLNRYVLIDYNHHFMKDYISLTRCYNCQRYHHKATMCQDESVCAICMGSHSTRVCNRQQDVKCINCAAANKNGAKYNIKHICGSRNCSFQLNLLKQIRTNTSTTKSQW